MNTTCSMRYKLWGGNRTTTCPVTCACWSAVWFSVAHQYSGNSSTFNKLYQCYAIRFSTCLSVPGWSATKVGSASKAGESWHVASSS